jgi:polyhydroxyalkanoate synthesis regulator protein
MITELQTPYEKALDAVIKTAQNGWITTKVLDAILLEHMGKDAGMCCNSFMRQGFIDYVGDGDWEVLVEYREHD